MVSTEQNNQTETTKPPKKAILGFMLTPPISLFGSFAYFLEDMISNPSHNDGAGMAALIFTAVLFISACISLSSFFVYNFLYSAESNFSAAFFLLIPFSGIILFSCLLLFLGGLNFATMLLAPFAVIYTIMLTILIHIRE
ncbi:MAG: hypothetical protein IJ905_01235 [Fibrobacter sp.]|nr:hypothetical protein [Fibrobacter sp.]